MLQRGRPAGPGQQPWYHCSGWAWCSIPDVAIAGTGLPLGSSLQGPESALAGCLLLGAVGRLELWLGSLSGRTAQLSAGPCPRLPGRRWSLAWHCTAGSVRPWQAGEACGCSCHRSFQALGLHRASLAKLRDKLERRGFTWPWRPVWLAPCPQLVLDLAAAPGWGRQVCMGLEAQLSQLPDMAGQSQADRGA